MIGIKKIILLIFILCTVKNYAQQGIVLSQPYMSVQQLSPAVAGNGVYAQRIQSNLKSQFLDGNNLYRTLVSGWDSRLKNTDPENVNYFGVGVQIISDQAMSGVFNSNYLNVNIAYHLYLDANAENELSLGLGATYGQTYLDKSKLRFGEGFNIDGSYTVANYDYLNSFKPYPRDFYYNTGLLFTRHTEKNLIQTGLTVSFLSRPKVLVLNMDTASGMKSSAFFNYEKEFEKLIKEWEGQTNLTKWDDLGFSLQGDTSTIHWLSSSLANTTFDCPLDRDKNSIFKSQNLVDWLDLITPDILKLDENSSEENG